MLYSAILTITLLTAPDANGPKPASNTRCPVLGNPVSEKSQVVTVRGRSYRICCAECGPQLRAGANKFLAPDGTPKNAGKPGPAGDSPRAPKAGDGHDHHR